MKISFVSNPYWRINLDFTIWVTYFFVIGSGMIVYGRFLIWYLNDYWANYETVLQKDFLFLYDFDLVYFQTKVITSYTNSSMLHCFSLWLLFNVFLSSSLHFHLFSTTKMIYKVMEFSSFHIWYHCLWMINKEFSLDLTFD